MQCEETEALIGQTWLKGRLQYCTNPDGTCDALGYYENGSIRFRFPIQDGEIHGVGKTWNENGALEWEQNYQNGVLHGPAYYWSANGFIQSESHYRNGIRQGIQKRWFLTGILATQRLYSEGRQNGLSLRWYPSGKLLGRTNYADDLRHGIREEYAEDGCLIAKQIYVRGVRLPARQYKKYLVGQLSAKDILAIRNSAVRRIFVEEFGYARILAEMPHEVIDRDGEQELVRIKGKVNEEPICLVKVKCPSTGAFYTLRVPPGRRTVKSAIAWTFDVPVDEYTLEKET